MTRKTTIHDLAKALGIDSSTVSRALNDSPRVGKKTKDRVLKMAKEMGYQRNLMASNLRMRKTMTIGVVVPFISRYVLSEAIGGIEQVASANDYQVIIAQTHDNVEDSEKAINTLFMNRIDGLLISPTQSEKIEEQLKQFTGSDIPVVMFDRYLETSNISKVTIDDRNVTKQLTKYLIETGKKNIYHIAGDLDAIMYRERCEGYKSAIQESDVEFDANKVISVELFPEVAVETFEKIRVDKPDALICANDVTAIAIIKHINENTDLRIPEDIAITGFSDSPASSIIKPSLTTVNQHPLELGRTAANLLLECIKDADSGSASKKSIVINSDIMIRESTN
ncbi:MAG: LacI family DNA-binding transcriptional regulator [Bacteroidota bacterium]